MMKNKVKVLKWKCGVCGLEHKSTSKFSHSMDFCDCGKSAVDIEEFYSRYIGKVIEIETKEECYEQKELEL